MQRLAFICFLEPRAIDFNGISTVLIVGALRTTRFRMPCLQACQGAHALLKGGHSESFRVDAAAFVSTFKTKAEI